MNWYKSSAKQTTTVYHVSPESDIYKFRPRGRHTGTQAIPMNQAGIYVTPFFYTALKWWFSFVGGKKRLKQKDYRSERLKDKGRGFHGKPMYYQTLTIYKLSIPKEIIENAWRSNFWEYEYFIPEESLDQVEIISRKTMNVGEALKLINHMERKNYESLTTERSDAIAERLKSSEIAKLYKELKEEYREALLSKKEYSPIIKKRINNNFNKLEFLMAYFSYGGPKSEHHVKSIREPTENKYVNPNPNPQEVAEAHRLAEEIRHYISLGKRPAKQKIEVSPVDSDKVDSTVLE